MKVFALEHSRAAYRADFVLYGAAVVGLPLLLMVERPIQAWPALAALALLGLAMWTLIEYAMHRFILHAMPPFRGWHGQHHARPTARIASPTILSAGLILGLVFVPALALCNVWSACALTLGVLIGYFGYAVTHHATHHWRAESAWLKRRKRAHALHHHRKVSGHYGVTSAFWDRVFRSDGR